MRFADPKSNIAFKKIFANENKKNILISFLNAALGLPDEQKICDITILDPYQAPKIEDLKETILDVKATDKRGITFIVEMQVQEQEYFAKRSLYYTSKAYISQIDSGAKYFELKPIIFIGILNFTMFEGADYLTRHLILNTKTMKQELSDFEFTFLELPKFNKRLEEIEEINIIEKWIYFLKEADSLEMIPEQLKEPNEIAEAFNIAEVHSWTKKEYEVYDWWLIKEAADRTTAKIKEEKSFNAGIQQGIQQGIKRGIEQGIERGIERGSIQEKYNIAKKMINEKMDIKIISTVTGLPVEDIKKFDVFFCEN